MTFEISLRVGDVNGDGHDKVDVYNIITNKSPGAVKQAYEKGTRKIGFSIVETLCKNEGDREISDEHWEQLAHAGILVGKHIADRTWLDRDEWVRLYMEVCKLGDPKLTWKHAKNASWIDIGGYGFFE